MTSAPSSSWPCWRGEPILVGVLREPHRLLGDLDGGVLGSDVALDELLHLCPSQRIYTELKFVGLSQKGRIFHHGAEGGAQRDDAGSRRARRQRIGTAKLLLHLEELDHLALRWVLAQFGGKRHRWEIRRAPQAALRDDGLFEQIGIDDAKRVQRQREPFNFLPLECQCDWRRTLVT